METLEHEVGVREYGQMLWRRRWLIVLVPVVLVGLSIAYSVTSTKIYEGTATLLLTPQLSSTIQAANNADIPAPTVDVPTDTQIMESAAVENIVRKTVPDPPAVTVTEVGTTNVVQVATQSPKPAVAAAAATAY